MKTTLGIRTLTGAILIVVIIAAIWIHAFSFLIMGASLTVLLLNEFYSLTTSSSARPQRLAGIITGLLIYIISVLISAGILDLKLILLILPCLFVLMFLELLRKQESHVDSLSRTFFGIVYIVIPFSLFPWLTFRYGGSITPILKGPDIFTYSPSLITAFFILIWVNDIGAYLTGSLIGKHQMFKRISPKKTWEGFFGGILLTVMISMILPFLFDLYSTSHWITIAIIISLSGTLGDLVESMLKRSSGQKDSGNSLPGHGGFLDRFDSALFSLPALFIYLELLV